MILFDTKYLQLKMTQTKDGHQWVYAHRPNVTDVVVILPIINNSKVLFITENRPSIDTELGNRMAIGIPAGLVGDERQGESLIDAVKAELLEEAGLVADKIVIKSKCIASSAGCTSETYSIAFAYVNEYKLKSQPIDDGGIIIKRELVDIKNIGKWLNEKQNAGYILTAQMLSALYYLKEEIK